MSAPFSRDEDTPRDGSGGGVMFSDFSSGRNETGDGEDAAPPPKRRPRATYVYEIGFDFEPDDDSMETEAFEEEATPETAASTPIRQGEAADDAEGDPAAPSEGPTTVFQAEELKQKRRSGEDERPSVALPHASEAEGTRGGYATIVDDSMRSMPGEKPDAEAEPDTEEGRAFDTGGEATDWSVLLDEEAADFQGGDVLPPEVGGGDALTEGGRFAEDVDTDDLFRETGGNTEERMPAAWSSGGGDVPDAPAEAEGEEGTSLGEADFDDVLHAADSSIDDLFESGPDVQVADWTEIDETPRTDAPPTQAAGGSWGDPFGEPGEEASLPEVALPDDPFREMGDLPPTPERAPAGADGEAASAIESPHLSGREMSAENLFGDGEGPGSASASEEEKDAIFPAADFPDALFSGEDESLRRSLPDTDFDDALGMEAEGGGAPDDDSEAPPVPDGEAEAAAPGESPLTGANAAATMQMELPDDVADFGGAAELPDAEIREAALPERNNLNEDVGGIADILGEGEPAGKEAEAGWPDAGEEKPAGKKQDTMALLEGGLEAEDSGEVDRLFAAAEDESSAPATGYGDLPDPGAAPASTAEGGEDAAAGEDLESQSMVEDLFGGEEAVEGAEELGLPDLPEDMAALAEELAPEPAPAPVKEEKDARPLPERAGEMLRNGATNAWQAVVDAVAVRQNWGLYVDLVSAVIFVLSSAVIVAWLRWF